MTFEEEWARLKSAHVPPVPVHTRLAGADSAGSGHPGVEKPLRVTASVLRKRAGRAEVVRGQLGKADDEAMRETGQVAGGLKGFATATALAAFQERWQDQMAYAKDQLTGTAEALRLAADAFTGEDLGTMSDLSRVGVGHG